MLAAAERARSSWKIFIDQANGIRCTIFGRCAGATNDTAFCANRFTASRRGKQASENNRQPLAGEHNLQLSTLHLHKR